MAVSESRLENSPQLMKEFFPFRLDPVIKCLWRVDDAKQEEERILLAPTAFAVLQYLVEHAGQLATQEQLLTAVWGDTYVQSQAVKHNILEVRAALGDDPKAPRFIETLPRRGYRFIAPVRESGSALDHSLKSLSRMLVGRDRVLTELQDYLRSTLRGDRQVVFVTGEPGIGKTSVVDAFEEWMVSQTAVRVSRGQCVEGYGGTEAYYPMLEALGKLCRRSNGDLVVETLAAEAPTWLVQFPALVKSEQRATLQREILGATRERMLREIGEALETLTAGNAIVLIFEDLQWVDHSTVDLISALARGRGPAKLMLIGTYRPTDVALSAHPLKDVKQDLLIHRLCHEIALEPLDEGQVAEFLSARSTQPNLLHGLAALLHRHSEGNPLFMVTALDHMRGRGLISSQSGSWQLNVPLEKIDLEVPENLRQMIETQLQRLTKEEQRALEAASVAGAIFSCSVGAAATDMEPETFGELCEGLLRRNLMLRPASPQPFPDGSVSDRYEFVHALYREVLYNRQVTAARANCHQRIGAHVERLFTERPREAAAELAHHFEQSRDWPRAVKYWRLVAENIDRRYASGEATNILQHALALASNLREPERINAETEMLARLAGMYLVSFDVRAIEVCETLVSRAGFHSLLDVEVRALVDMVYPLSWISAERCLRVVNRALELSARQKDPLMRARTRASCLVRRIWAGGWNVYDADECQKALAEIRQTGDRFVLASHLIDCNFLLWVSSEYREARRNAVESLEILLGADEENPYQTTAYWMSEFILPWSLLYLGEWGEMVREIRAGISMAERNGDAYRAYTLQLYQAWLYFHAMDFAGVVEICESVLPRLGDPPWRPWRRFCLGTLGGAHTALGNYPRARECLFTVREEMDKQTVIHDWYRGMQLEWELSDLCLATGDLPQARSHAIRLLSITESTPERTWQALGWDTNARIALAELDFENAQGCITKALLRLEGGWEAPLAVWRVHATGAKIADQMGNSGLAEYHRQMSRATILKLASSLPAEEPLRTTFLSAAPIREVLDA